VSEARRSPEALLPVVAAPGGDPGADARRERLYHATLAGAVALPLVYLLLPLLPLEEPVTGGLRHTTSVLAAGWALLALGRSLRTTRVPRTARLLVVYCGLRGAGELLRAIHEVVGRQAPEFPSTADLAVLCAAPFGVMAMVALLRGGPIRRLRALLDGTLVVVSLVAVLLLVVIEPVASAALAGWELGLLLAFPLADIAMLTILVVALPVVDLLSVAKVALIFLGLLAFTAADTAFVQLVVLGAPVTGVLVDVGWLWGFLLLAAAAWRPPTREDLPASSPGAPRLIGLLLPNAAVVPMVAVGLWQEATTTRVHPAGVWLGAVSLVVLVVRQTVTLVESEQRARDLHVRASRDALTGLLNRHSLRGRVDAVLAREGHVPALLFIDVDDFKVINDTLGHSAGDKILAALASRLQHSVRPQDQPARLGGDEFAVLLARIEHPREAITVAERVIAAMTRPIVVDGVQRILSVSVGIAVHEHEGDTAEELLRNADLAMYSAKGRGKDRYAIYEPSLHADATARLNLTDELRRAVTTGQFVLHFQPTVDLREGAVTGAEALIRWAHPQRGLLKPPEFLPVAVESGMGGEIYDWVVTQACAAAAGWQRSGLLPGDFRLGVNVDAEQIVAGDFAADLQRVLERCGWPPSQLVLELVESSLVDARSALPVFADLEAQGVRLAIDDFGTGYSSLSYLRRLPVHVLKIDKAFVAELDQGAEGEAMTRAIIALASSMNLTTIAEGVERRVQVSRLLSLGCEEAQGYLYTEPLPLAAMTELLRRAPSAGWAS
jgi:diguanylate cyclase (GGDEF)-like protein